MNMLLPPPKSPLRACVCLGPLYQGQGLPGKFSLATFPKKAEALPSPTLPMAGAPTRASCFLVSSA